MASSTQLPAATISETAELLKQLIAAVNVTSKPENVMEATASEVEEDKEKEKTTPRYKVVNESWHSTEHRYKIVESPVEAIVDTDSIPFIFVVRMRSDKGTGNSTAYIDVKSTKLRKALQTVLGDVIGLSLKDVEPSIQRNVLYHYLGRLETFARSETHHSSEAHMEVLINHLQEAFHEVKQSLTKLRGEITYNLLWTLFKPDDIIFTRCPGTKVPRCLKVSFSEERQTMRGKIYFYVEGRCLDFDGHLFGESRVMVPLEKFRGTKKIPLLEAFPLRHHPRREAVVQQLVSCGRKFVELVGCHHRECHGPAFFMQKEGPLPVQVDGRVTVDAELFRQQNPTYVGPNIDQPTREYMNDLAAWGAVEVSEPANTVMSTGINPTNLTEGELLVCSPTVLGFSYSDKLWLEIAVNGISNIEWDECAWDNLVLGKDSKDIILALASAHLDNTTRQSVGVTRHRGQGLNMLLHGPPGVGKTLTAESLAEHLRRPLYPVSASELGTEPKNLEDCLKMLFQLARRWNAILLLDEADVYLEQRTPENLARNALVSVFLRELEFFGGFLILTTNRVDDFDTAILNRLHWKRRYSEIDKRCRTDIWKKVLDKVETKGAELELREDELEKLVQSSMNGRQITNHVTTACALARHEGKPLSVSHLQIVIGAEQGFERDFTKADSLNSVFK